MAKENLSIVWKNYKICIIQKDIKGIKFKLDDKGYFSLSLPYFYPLKKLDELLEKNEKWLEKAWQIYQKNATKDDEVLFLGKKYKLVLDTNLSKTYFFKDEIKTPNLECLKAFLGQNARIIFNFYLKKWQRKIGLYPKKITLKTMKTRWGSCNSKKSYINLNLKLIEKPLKGIEYVILHELSHLKFPNHGKEFYAFLLENMEDFREREQKYFAKFTK